MSTGRNVLLVGSVALDNAEQVFRAAAKTFGHRLKRIPDGETGERSAWIQWQRNAYKNNTALFEDIRADSFHHQGFAGQNFRIRRDVNPADIDVVPLGYADCAEKSYREFKQLKESGVVHEGCRFQVSLPTPAAGLAAFVIPADHDRVEAYLEAQLIEEVRQISAFIPAEELAVQWDAAFEIAFWEGIVKSPSITRERLIDSLSRCGEGVPTGAELGYHLCYGDLEHKHFLEPENTANLVDVANRISSTARRNVDWIHMPVPRERDDDDYFRPLENLALRRETELYLGLVHLTGGVEGSHRRIGVASRYVKDFGIATECGMGRRDPQTIRDLLRVHGEV